LTDHRDGVPQGGFVLTGFVAVFRLCFKLGHPDFGQEHEMIRDSNGNVRLTKSEHNKLRKYNAQNGIALGEVKTDEEYREAVYNGLPPEIVDDMLEFFETGNSPLTRKGIAERELTQASNALPDDV
jgi:hypothetical protein